MLKAKLLAPKIQKFLKNFGYKNFKNTDGVLEHLQKRINEGDGFPHEIGIFLDYPLRDVKGFIIHKGKNFLASGCWKVYVNKNEALRRFENYEQCRRDACKKFDQGLSVSDILSIA